MTTNGPSIAVLERTGFRREATLASYRVARGVPRDFHHYSVACLSDNRRRKCVMEATAVMDADERVAPATRFTPSRARPTSAWPTPPPTISQRRFQFPRKQIARSLATFEATAARARVTAAVRALGATK